MFNAKETWSEKDKQIINVKTTRNNLGNLSNTISQFYRRLGLLNLIGCEQCSFKIVRLPVRTAILLPLALYQGAGVGVYSMWGLCGGREARK